MTHWIRHLTPRPQPGSMSSDPQLQLKRASRSCSGERSCERGQCDLIRTQVDSHRGLARIPAQERLQLGLEPRPRPSRRGPPRALASTRCEPLDSRGCVESHGYAAPSIADAPACLAPHRGVHARQREHLGWARPALFGSGLASAARNTSSSDSPRPRPCGTRSWRRRAGGTSRRARRRAGMPVT